MNISNTPRLQFDFIDESDADFLFSLDQNPHVMRYINGGKPNSKHLIQHVFLPRLSIYRNKTKGFGLWKVTVNETQQSIGWVLARPIDFFNDTSSHTDIELGWRFIESSWGKGYATEAALHILQVLKNVPDYKFFSASALARNSASINVMKKLGMQCVKNYLHSDDYFHEEPAVLYRMKNDLLK